MTRQFFCCGLLRVRSATENLSRHGKGRRRILTNLPTIDQVKRCGGGGKQPLDVRYWSMCHRYENQCHDADADAGADAAPSSSQLSSRFRSVPEAVAVAVAAAAATTTLELLRATQNHQQTTSKNVKAITFSCCCCYCRCCCNNNLQILAGKALGKSRKKSQLPLTFQASPEPPR